MERLFRKEGLSSGWHRFGLVVPAYVGLMLLLIIGGSLNRSFWQPGHLATICVLASFLIVVGFGQGLAMLTGGIDLSIPYTLTLGAVLASILGPSYHLPFPMVVLIVLVCCATVGLANGLGIVWLGLPPLIMTLVMNTFLTGVVLLVTNGVPAGSAPVPLSDLMHGTVAGVPTVLLPLAVFVALAALLLARTTYGRKVYAVGNGERTAYLSGVDVRWVKISVYMISALCAGMAGLMLLGFSDQSFIGMGDNYLLPSIAVVVIGGGAALGGKGLYLGTVGGALLLEVLSTVSGAAFSGVAVQDIIYGAVIFLAMIVGRFST